MRFLILFLLFAFGGASLHSQTESCENEIVMMSELSPEELYERINKQMILNGHSLDVADANKGIIETLPFTVRWGFLKADIMEVSYTCRIVETDNGSQALLTGKVALGSGDLSYPAVTICKGGPENSAIQTSWVMMTGLADKLPVQSVEYRVNPKLKVAMMTGS